MTHDDVSPIVVKINLAKTPTELSELSHHQDDAHYNGEGRTMDFEAARRADSIIEHKNNIFLLALVCILFGCFAIAQIIAAIIGNSLSLLGDSSSMIVDAVTYGLNMVAEMMKKRGVSEIVRVRLELGIPLFSMLALIATSLYIIEDAAVTIATVDEIAADEQNVTNDTLMLIFSCINLSIDIFSVTCFARFKACLGFSSVDIFVDPYNLNMGTKRKGNTNMCSAYTHVIADTMRSSAVVIAAIISITVDTVNPNLADAWAAITVSLIIFISMIPLGRGLVQKCIQLRHLDQERNTNNIADIEL